MAGYFGRGRPITGINPYTKTQSDDRFRDSISGDMLPDSDDTRDLGSSSKAWAEAYVNNLTVAGNAIATAGSLSNRNKIINGAMVIDQRNAGAAVTIDTTANVYTLDRWAGSGQLTDGVFTVDQTTDAPAGFTNSLRVTVTTADASIGATQNYLLTQFVEGFNCADLDFGKNSAKAVTLSFWVRSSATGTFGGVLQNNGNDRAYPFTYAISSANTWEYKTITIAGDTTGTWLTDSGRGLVLRFQIGVGSSRAAAAGAWTGTSSIFGATGAVNLIETLNATWDITGVQLEAGDTATPFEHRSYGQELALCQRYYSIFRPQAQTPVTQFMITPFYFPVQMRAIPTLTQISAGNSANAAINGAVADSTFGGYFQISASAANGYVLNAIYSASAEL